MLRAMEPGPSVDNGHPRRARLDRETILAMAREIADNGGIGALTLRRLGRELGADSTAMYRYFRNKAELLSAMIDQTFHDVPEPDPEGDWRSNLRGLMSAWWRIYRRHEGLSAVMAGQPDDESRLFFLTEWTVRELLRAGIPHDEIGLFHQTIYNHTVGSGLVAAYSPWLTTRGLRDEQRRIYAALDPEKFPSAAVAAPTIYPETEDAYLFSVDLLLDAIESRARAAAESTADLRFLKRRSRADNPTVRA
jgi:AcrR family transcriptional regulator